MMSPRTTAMEGFKRELRRSLSPQAPPASVTHPPHEGAATPWAFDRGRRRSALHMIAVRVRASSLAARAAEVERSASAAAITTRNVVDIVFLFFLASIPRRPAIPVAYSSLRRNLETHSTFVKCL
jgi:hypothetical protein